MSEMDLQCPKCGAPVRMNRGGAFCTQEAECDFRIWRKIVQKELSDKQLGQLVKGEKILVAGFMSKRTGKPYSANIFFNGSETKMDFEGLSKNGTP